MQNIKCKKRINRIIAGLVSAAMAFTMVPDVWLPVHAEIVSNQIKNADIGTAAARNELDKYSYTKYEFNGNTYAFIENEMLWNEAREVCEKLGGHLAYINSEAEQEFITEITKNYYTALGGWDELSEGEWTWLDSSEMTFTNWRSGEPNNSYPHQNHLYINYSGAGKWDDGYDNRMAPFVCEWENDRSEHNVGILSEYTIFSSNINEDITLNGWKSSITGGIYSGRDFICNLSEFYLDGKADTVGTVTANGWKINIPEKNENIEAAAMPDLEEAILARAGEYTYYSENPSYIQDTNIINGSIMVAGDVIISGTNFEGDCYIIADGDIVYNINALNTTGRLVLYSRNGNITVNGTNININGIMYAPKGKVSFNANETTVNGRIWADNVNFSGSIFNIKGSEDDLDLIGDTDIETPTEYSVLSQGESKYGYKHEFVENEWSLGKDTTFGPAMIELVPNEYNKSGFSYYRISKRLEDNFSFLARFTFSIDYTTSLADGLAFVIQTDDTLAGTIGKGIGYGNISPSLAVEFDDYRNNEPNGNHIGVMLNGNCDKHYAIYDYEELNNNGAVHDAWIEYDGVNKMLYVAAAQYDENGNVHKPQQAMISYNIDLNELLAGQEYVYFGITSATGSSRASHKLHGVEFDPSPDSLYYADEPVIDITASFDKVNVGEEAYFTVNATHEDKIKDIGYTLNGMPVTASDGKYILDTAEEGTYTFEANAVTSSGKNISASATIEVVNSGKPIVDLIFDKDSYAEGDDVIVTVTATDETGIGGMALEYDGLQAELDENNSYTVKKITAGKHTIVGIAWNTAGAVSSAEYEITINPKGSEPADELTLNAEIDTSKIKVGEPFDINITAKGGVGEKKISCTVNNESIPVIDSKASYTPEQFGTYDIAVSAVDEAGSNITKRIKVTISESGADIEDDDENEYDEDCDYVNKYQPSPVVRVIPEQTVETEVKLTAEMIDMIEQLASPTAVYEYLYNNVNCEFYTGSRKGAIGTFEQNGGNDVDCASLLIACLRYMGYEAEYVTGTICLDSRQVMKLTCTDDLETALKVLGIAGRSGTVSGNKIYIDHTWVSAEIDGQKYELDISFKYYEKLHLFNDYVNESMNKIDISDIKESSDIYWLMNPYENNHDQMIIAQKTIIKREISELPLSLPYICDTIMEQTNDICDSRYIARDYMTVEFGGEAYKIYASELASSSVTIGFESDLYYGSTPVLYIDNNPAKRWKSCSSSRGTRLVMNISVSTSGQRYYYSKEILAGSSHAIVTDTQIVSAQDILTAFDRMPVAENERALVNTENVFKDKYIGNLLNLIGKAYFAQLDIESKILANAQNIYAERYISVGVFSYTPTFIENLGAVRELDQGGYSVDIIGNNCAAVSLDGNETSEKSYYFGAGYVSSYFEHLVLEQFIGIDSVSTAKVFIIAAQNGIDFKIICSENADEISTLVLNASDISEIRSYVNSGKTVIVPTRNISINDWTGTGFIVQDLDNNEIIFRLSNGLNGGYTTTDAKINFSFMTVLTCADIGGSLMGIVGLLTALSFATPLSWAVGIIGTAVLFGVFCSVICQYYEAANLYVKALLGNEEATKALYELAKFNGIAYIFAMAITPVVQPVAKFLSETKIGQKFLSKVNKELFEKSPLVVKDAYDNWISKGYSEDAVSDLLGDSKFPLYSDDLVEAALKSDDPAAFASTMANCSDDVVRALNASDDKDYAVRLITENSEDGINQLLREYENGGNVISIESNKRLNQIEIEFNYKPQYDEGEFARQLADQENGMNQLTVEEYLKNRQKYINEGRAAESKVYQQQARDMAYFDKVNELCNLGKSKKEAENIAKKWLESEAALHNPDMIAGGKPQNVGGMGDSRINSSIGSQWQYRIDEVDKQIEEMARWMTDEEKATTYLNVKLSYTTK